MTSITIRVYLHETSRPIRGLAVTWYATPDQSLRKELLDPDQWDKARARRSPIDFGLTRLGSTTTDADGMARIEHRVGTKDPTARTTQSWYTIRTTDVAGEPDCSRTIHVACELTPMTADHEEFAVRIPQRLLDHAGAQRRSSPTIDGSRSLGPLHTALKAVSATPAQPRPNVAGSIGSALNARLAQGLSGKLGDAEAARRALSAAAGVELRSANGLGRPVVSFDSGVGALTVRDPVSQADIPLRFTGVVRYRNAKLTESAIERPHAVVDETGGTVAIVLPQVPDDLVASEPTLTRLFQYLDRR